MERYDGSTYEQEPQGEYRSFRNQDGTRDRNPANEVGKYFEFTKTAYKPYDLAVTVALVIAKHHLKEEIVIRSDGAMENWHEAMQLCHHFLGYGRGFCLDEDGAVPLDTTGADAITALFKKNQAKMSRLKADHEGLSNEKGKKQNEIRDRYNAVIRELQKQRDFMIGGLENEIGASQAKLNKDVGELSAAGAKIDRIIAFLRAGQKDLDTARLDKMGARRGKHLEIVESLTDDCIDLRLLIFENDRPKNRYTIAIAGTSKIGGTGYKESILDLPQEYVSGLDFSGNVLHEGMHLPTLDAARKHAKARDIRGMLKGFFKEYDKVHEEYRQACQKYTLKDFSEFMEERFKIHWASLSEWSRKGDLEEHKIGTDDIEKMTRKQINLLMKSAGYEC